jgi:hypothetical protein
MIWPRMADGLTPAGLRVAAIPERTSTVPAMESIHEDQGGTAVQIIQTIESTTTTVEPHLVPPRRDRRLLLVRLAGEMGVKSSRTWR